MHYAIELLHHSHKVGDSVSPTQRIMRVKRSYQWHRLAMYFLYWFEEPKIKPIIPT